jgi:hypothetical protein
MVLNITLALALILTAFGSAIGLSIETAYHFRDRATAVDLQVAAVAAQQYLSNNAQTIEAGLAPGASAAIPLTTSQGLTSNFPSVQSQGLIDNNFSGIDPYSQNLAIIVTEVSSNEYYAIVISYGGTSIANADLGQILSLAGGLSGAVTRQADGGSSANILGLYNSWSAKTSEFSGNSSGVPITAGHYAYLLNLQPASTTLSDYMNRNNTGDVEANTMHSNMRLNNNSITNVQSLTWAGGGSIADDGHGGLVFGSDLLTVLGNYTSEGPLSVTNQQVIAGSNIVTGSKTIDGSQTVTANLATPITYFGQNPQNGSATIGAACSPAGTVTAANDGKSTIVGCTNGVWTALGGSISGFSSFITLACGPSASWTNPGPGPAIMYVEDESAQNDGGYTLTATDPNGNQSSVYFDSYAQGYQVEAGNDIIVPPLSTFSASVEQGTACYGGWH